jgi:Tfp pilus assembly protein PilF
MWSVLSFRNIPADRVAVVGGSETASILRSGWRFIPLGLRRVVLYPRGPFEVRFPEPEDTLGGKFRVFSAEGAEMRTGVRVNLEIPEAGLLRYHALARGRFESPVREAVRTTLREHASRIGARELTENPRRLASSMEGDLKAALGEAGALLLALSTTDPGMAPGAGAALSASHAASTNRRVLVLGVDAADWTLINRLKSQGRLPALAEAQKTGASAPLRSIEPLLSPLIWTTIATGVGPEEHGILDFLTPDPSTGAMVPATSRIRRAPALWNIAPAYGKKAGVIGWLATWPAEPIDGFVVSDRFGFLAFAGQTADVSPGDDIVFPADFLAGRTDSSLRSRDVPASQVRRFLDVSAAEIEAARRPGYEKGNRINNFIHTLATADSYARLAIDACRRERPPLMLVYFEFIDAVCHLFMASQPPARPGVSPEDVRRFGGAVDRAYEHQDRIIAEFVRAASDSTIIFIVSDHGFRSGDARLTGSADMEDAAAARWHLPDGVIIISGPGVRRGAAIANPSVFDVAPTILAVLGCPIPAAMRGRVLAEAFEPGFLSREDSLRVAEPLTVGFTPPAIAPAAMSSDAPPADAEDRADRPAGGGGGPAGESEAARHVNLGVILAKEGKLDRAEREFEEALRIDPLSRAAANNLASIYMKQSRFPDATRVLERILNQDPGYALGWSNLGVCAQRSGRKEEALRHYDRSLELEPADQRSLTNRGFLLLELKRPDGAERDFRKALMISGRSAQARYGLGVALAEQGLRDQAVKELELALAADPSHDRARQALEQLRAGP